MSHIELRGVRVHNLKGIDLRLPLGSLIAITGVSGAGKSSLAFDTLVAEGQRRYIETFAPSARQFLERIERPDADALENLPPAIAFRAESSSDQRATLGTITETDDLLRMLFARLGRAFCPQCETPLVAHTADEVCRELQSLPDGMKFVVAFPSEKSDDAIANWGQLGFVRTIELPESDFSNFKSQLLVVVDRLVAGRTDVARVLESIEQAYSHGDGRCVVLAESDGQDRQTLKWEGRNWRLARHSQRLICGECGREHPPLEPDLFNFESSLGACPRCSGLGRIATSATVRHLTMTDCSECGGSRLGVAGRSVQLFGGRTGRSAHPTIAELRELRLTQLATLLDELALVTEPSEQVLVSNLLGELSARLRTLLDLGLGHLSMSRSPRTLSRGERQRARLAGVLATRLDNALYVLDEPSGGLHPLDAERVLTAILRLQQAGNTVILVEHSESFIEAADEVIELGPGAGREGGRVCQHWTQSKSPLPLGKGGRRMGEGPELSESSPRVETLSERKQFERSTLAISVDQPSGPHPSPLPMGEGTEHGSDHTPRNVLMLNGVTLHNLKDQSVAFPLNRLCVVTGVSGSGKSSLIQHTLYPVLCRRFGTACEVDPVGEFTMLSGAEQIDEVVFLDSSPIRRSARASAATMLHLLGEIRNLFAQTTEAKVKNFTARHYSFNASEGGRCPRCRGLGAVEIDMQFLANLTVVCPECHGSRFQREVLDAKLRGLSIAEVLNLSADEAFSFFRGQPQLQRRLKSLKDVGLGYLPLGQSASTLSRGECQRLKLATLLGNRSRKRTLFLMDEPCIGLHARDIAVLLECFRRLIEVGHSLIAIEHRPEFIRAADWVIELGPGAGDAGGRIVTAGVSPADVE